MPENRRQKLRRRIRQIKKNHPGKYLGKWWRWATKGGEYRDNKRWAALAAYSHRHRQYAWKRSYKAKRYRDKLKKRGKPHHVVHRALLWSQHWASRARHYAHIEKLYRQEKRRLKKRIKSGELSGLVQFDGKTVAAWIVWKVLIPARRSGLWGGVCYSGYRTPEYSESLCYAMCGRPACSGMCAGRASNHAKYVEPDGAVDVSDSQGLSVWESRNGYPTRHTLPLDLPHHSRTGQ